MVENGKRYTGGIYFVKNEKYVTGCEIKRSRMAMVLAETKIESNTLLLIAYITGTTNERTDIVQEIRTIENLDKTKKREKSNVICNQVYSIDANRATRFIEKADILDFKNVCEKVKLYIDGGFDNLGRINEVISEFKPDDSSKLDKLISDLLIIRNNMQEISYNKKRILSGEDDSFNTGIFKSLSDKQIDSILKDLICSLDINITSLNNKAKELMMDYLAIEAVVSNNKTINNELSSNDEFSKEKTQYEDNSKSKATKVYTFEYLDNLVSLIDDPDFQSTLSKIEMTKEIIMYLINKGLTKIQIAKIFNTSESSVYRVLRGGK